MTYRVGNHHGVTIVSEGDGARCGRPEHDCERGHLVAVVIDGGQELAERIAALLNADAGPCPANTGLLAATLRCDLRAGHAGVHESGSARWWERDALQHICDGSGPGCPLPPPTGLDCICLDAGSDDDAGRAQAERRRLRARDEQQREGA